MYRRMDGWVDGWVMDERMDGWAGLGWACVVWSLSLVSCELELAGLRFSGLRGHSPLTPSISQLPSGSPFSCILLNGGHSLGMVCMR